MPQRKSVLNYFVVMAAGKSQSSTISVSPPSLSLVFPLLQQHVLGIRLSLLASFPFQVHPLGSDGLTNASLAGMICSFPLLDIRFQGENHCWRGLGAQGGGGPALLRWLGRVCGDSHAYLIEVALLSLVGLFVFSLGALPTLALRGPLTIRKSGPT